MTAPVKVFAGLPALTSKDATLDDVATYLANFVNMSVDEICDLAPLPVPNDPHTRQAVAHGLAIGAISNVVNLLRERVDTDTRTAPLAALVELVGNAGDTCKASFCHEQVFPWSADNGGYCSFECWAEGTAEAAEDERANRAYDAKVDERVIGE